MLKLLLENGADLYAINNVKHTHVTMQIFIQTTPSLQDGNTPYSFALSGGNMDIANYVMSFASRAPQRDSGGQMTIYTMQV